MKRLIENQRALDPGRGSYGPLGSAAANGCGFVALYNLYVLLGRTPSAARLLEKIRRGWLRTTLLGGLFGTNPFYVLGRLRALDGVRLTWYRNVGRRKLPAKHAAYFIFYLYGFGAHYAVAEQQAGALLVHNDCAAADWREYFQKTGAWLMVVAGVDTCKTDRSLL